MFEVWPAPGAREGPTGNENQYETPAKGQLRTAAATTTRSTFKIEDPSRGPGRVNFRGPEAGFGFEGTPKPKIQGDPPPKKETLYVVRRCTFLLKLCPP